MEKNLKISQADMKTILEKLGVSVKEVRRYSIFKTLHFSDANQEQQLDIDVPPGYNRIARIAIYTDINDASNNNLIIAKPLEIDGIEVVSEGFPTRLLFPKFGNEMYTDIDWELDGQKSKLSCGLQDVAMAAGGEAYYCYVLLILEKDLD